MKCHCRLVRTASRKITALYDKALEPAGINVAQFSLLKNIASAKAISLTELGLILELDRSTIGRNVKLLVRSGLVESGSGHDHREAVVRLSTKGQSALKRGTRLWNDAQSAVEAKLGAGGIATLRALLSDLTAGDPAC